MRMKSVATAAVLASVALAAGPTHSRPATWRLDGVLTSADEFHEHEDVQAVLARYRAAWRDEHPAEPVTEAQATHWRVLGQRVGRTFRVAQFAAHPHRGTRVVVSLRDLAPARSPTAPSLPLPPGARVIREIEMSEGFARVRQVYALYPGSAQAAQSGLAAAARLAGWDPLVPRIEQRADGERVHAWRRGDSDLLVVTGGGASAASLLLHVTTVRDAPEGAR